MTAILVYMNQFGLHGTGRTFESNEEALVFLNEHVLHSRIMEQAKLFDANTGVEIEWFTCDQDQRTWEYRWRYTRENPNIL